MIPRWDAFLRSFWVINAIRSSRRRYKASFAINIKLSNISSRNWPHLRVCQSVWLLVNYELLSQRPNWEYSTVQYSTGSWYLFIDIIILTRDARIRFNLKRTVLSFSSVRSSSRDNYHGYGDIIILCALKLFVDWLFMWKPHARLLKSLAFFTILLTKWVNLCYYFKMYFVFGKLFSISTASVCFFSWRLSVFNSLIVLTSKYYKGYILVIFNEKGYNNRNNRQIIVVYFCRNIFQNREMSTFYSFWL